MKIKSFLLFALLSIALTINAQPKYIFYFIGDGMGVVPVIATTEWNRTVYNGQRPLTMTQFPIAGYCTTYSVSGSITDSAAAGTALSTGHKTINGMLGVTPDSVPVYSMANVLKDNGYGVGVVTTVFGDDATPGAFYAHVPSRKMTYDIDCQFIDGKVDFLACANLKGMKDSKGNPTDIKDKYAKNNIKVVYSLDELAKVDKKSANKIVLIEPNPFNDSNVGFTMDSIPGMLTITQMTQACLDNMLEKSPDKFFMMVEGGNIDHALHSNDAGTAMTEIYKFDEAIQIAYNFYLQHPDETLIVITADHDTGGMVIGRGGKYYADFNAINRQTISKDMLSLDCKAMLTSRSIIRWEDMQEYLTAKLGFWTDVKLSDAQTQRIKEAFDKSFGKRNEIKDEKTLYASHMGFAVEVYKVLDEVSRISWSTSGHSGNPVPVFAIGKGAEVFSSLNNNIEIPAKILNLAGYKLY